MSSTDEENLKATAAAKPERKRPRKSMSGEKPLLCNLCQLEKIPDFENHQPLLEFQDLRAHYFCLLFSSGLGQSGQESEGLHGFMPSDVRRELKRGARLKCVYCKLKGATVGCAKQECKKSYHLPCGMKHGSLQEFFDQYKSFCSLHRPVQKLSRNQAKKQQKTNSKDPKSSQCSICQEPVIPKPCFKSILAPCCSSGSWFHRSCLQTMALKQGQAQFKCPLCNNKDKFTSEMNRLGIYLPQHASEDDPGAAPNAGPKECGAKVCFCDHEEGRGFNDGDFWDLLVCFSCGSSAIHAKCGGMDDLIDPQWNCYVCRRMVKNQEETDKRSQRPINELWGTALGKKPPKTLNGVTISQKSDSSNMQKTNNPLLPNGTFEYSNTVTITPIPKHQIKEYHSQFPMPNEIPSGVEISMVTNNVVKKDTMKLSLDDIILAGLERQPEATNYQCTKAFAEQFNAADTSQSNKNVNNKKRANSLDTEQGSPGDSDYESAQEQGQLPFKIRKNANNDTISKQKVNSKTEKSSPVHNSPTSLIDSRIQKSIKDFFNSS